MTRTVRIHPDADDEVASAAAWYDARDDGLGSQFLAAVDRTIKLVARSPSSFAAWPVLPICRRAVVPQFPFIVCFVERGDAVLIVAVAHGRRRPGYWLHRIGADPGPTTRDS